MFLNQVHYMWRELGRVSGLRPLLIAAAPLFLLLLIVLVGRALS